MKKLLSLLTALPLVAILMFSPLVFAGTGDIVIEGKNVEVSPKGIAYGASYFPDYNETNQGATGGGRSTKDYIDAISTDSATLVFQHTSGSATTTYTFTTDETISSNINVIIEKGAILNTDLSIRNATYKWTAGGGGVSEYYLELAAGGNPGISESSHCAENNSAMTIGTVDSLAVGEWDWADSDALGYSTVYVRLSDSTDPDSKAADYVEAGYTLTINGPFNAGLYQVFSGTGSISFGNDIVGITTPKWKGTTGLYNVAIGTNSMLNAGTTVEENTAVGHNTLKNATKDGNDSHGRRNVAIGHRSLETNTTGHENTAVGYTSLLLNTTGEQNAALGYDALQHNTAGNYNVAVGRDAAVWNTIGNNNTAIGHESLQQLTEGDGNTALGQEALRLNTTGSYNIGVGQSAGYGNVTGDNNIAIGKNALNSNIAGTNMGIGRDAGNAITSGSGNIIVGYLAGQGLTIQDNNIVIGDGANVTGTGNIVIGHDAGNNYSGTVVSNNRMLWVENRDTSQPLIYGRFDENGLGDGKFIVTNQSGVASKGERYGGGNIYTTAVSETHTLAAALTSDTTTISIPAYSILLGASFNVDVQVEDGGGLESWTAAFITGDTSNLTPAGAASGVLNTKVDTLITPKASTNTVQVRFTSNDGSFAAGVIQVVVYFMDLTSLFDQGV